ncbi:hypothetical protein BG454_18480 [Roseinatronobacter bogoriensis subsp. barguzinensis]|uniref:Uncharacterized protein n=1 Tax=Roseinatronobacter bogoriensis subsp. barguzinensis TaxID=441209 RepID=A0A2K8KIF4_9RHOB|nr:hypothetical protein BG454_18480 [Rhodobaca barguzinensis]
MHILAALALIDCFWDVVWTVANPSIEGLIAILMPKGSGIIPRDALGMNCAYQQPKPLNMNEWRLDDGSN